MYKVSGLCHFLVQAEESLQHAPQVLGGSDHDDLHKKRLLPRRLALLLPVYAKGGAMCALAFSVLFQLPFTQVFDLLPQADIAGMPTGHNLSFSQSSKNCTALFLYM